jgi:hypothetical protein
MYVGSEWETLSLRWNGQPGFMNLHPSSTVPMLSQLCWFLKALKQCFGPPGSGSFCNQAKIVRKTLISL